MSELREALNVPKDDFERWWFNEGIHHMPRGDQPPEHATIARLAWTAALASHPSDLKAKLESLRDWMGEQMKSRPWTIGSRFDEAHKRLTAIIEGKD